MVAFLNPFSGNYNVGDYQPHLDILLRIIQSNSYFSLFEFSIRMWDHIVYPTQLGV